MILYEDEYVLVIHKPAGIATQTSRLGQADVESELKNYLAKNNKAPYLAIIHRLDQPVEGLLVFAKTPQAAKILSADLQKGNLKKSYHALVYCKAELPDKEIKLTDYLLKDSRTNLSNAVSPNTAGAKKAELTWKAEYMTNRDNVALIEIMLHTGRHHQIRVQMSNAGMPLIGDMKYGNDCIKRISEEMGIKQTALLADRLEFIHPKTKKNMSFSIPYPEKWQKKIV